MTVSTLALPEVAHETCPCQIRAEGVLYDPHKMYDSQQFAPYLPGWLHLQDAQASFVVWATRQRPFLWQRQYS